MGTQVTLPKRGHNSPQFSAHVFDQSAGWIKMPPSMEVTPGDIVLDEDPVPPPTKGTQLPQFSVTVCCGQTVAHLSYC